MYKKVMPKILIGCPSSEKKDYCFLTWIAHVRNIDYPKDRMEIMMADNSPTYKYVEYLRSLGLQTRHIYKDGKTPIEYLCESHNAIRDYFLKKDFDYLFHLESDVMVKPQTLRTLLFHSIERNLPVVSASYFKYHIIDTTMLSQQNEEDAIGIDKKVRAIGYKECINSLTGDLQRTWGCGIGAVLIKRWVVEKIPFRFQREDNIYPDSWFYDDLDYNNIPIYMDTNIILRHESMEWQRNLEYHKNAIQ